MAEVQTELLNQATPEAAAAIARLVPQMTVNRVPEMTVVRLNAIIQSGTLVVLGRLDGQIVGVGVLGKIEQLVGTKYWLEDIVVDEVFRSRGVARAVVNELLGHVPSGAYSVNLTSKMTRPEAQAWYQRLGFELSSNVFRLKRRFG